MTIRRPAAELTLDGRALTAPESALAGVRVDLGMGSAHDRVALVLSPLSPVADSDPGAELELSLGYGDDLEPVFTGTVVAVERRPGAVLVEALAKSFVLSTTRAARSYLQQTIADIVRDLADHAAVDTGDIEATLTLYAYHLDERRTLWAHVQDLARVAGCDVTSDATGALCFRPPRTGPADHRLRHGAELVSWSLHRRAAQGDPPAVVAYGAASDGGADAWHLLVREPAGSPPEQPTLIHSALRDRDGADAYADALANAASRRQVRGHVVAVGDATIRPAALIELSDVPGPATPALRAMAVTHVVDAQVGFVSRLHVEAAS